MVNMTANLALSIVFEELEIALENFTIHPYGKTLAVPQSRQELMVAVLRKLSVAYIIVDDLHQPSPKPRLPYYSLELRLKVEDCIHREIQHFLQEKSAWN